MSIWANIGMASWRGWLRPLALLAIVERELRVAARRPATYRIRWIALLGALLLIAWRLFSLAWQSAPIAQQGRSLFVWLSVLAFVYCLFVGVRATSDCISEEKREGTLGLLFLTDLTGLDVVLGKLAATSLNALYGLLAIFPALAIPLVLGGVSLIEFGQMTLVLLVTLFFSLAMGLLVSSLSRNERKAASATVAAVLAPSVLPLALLLIASWIGAWGGDLLDSDIVLRWIFGASSLPPFATAVLTSILWLELLNPVYALICVLFANAAIPGLPVWTSTGKLFLSLGLIHGLSWIALHRTARILPRVWKDRPASRTVVHWRERWVRFSQGTAEARRTLRERLLDVNPFFWLTGRDRLKPHYAWLFVLSMAGVWLWRYFKEPDVMFEPIPLIPTVLIIHGFLKIWVIAESSQKLVEDQRSGALELLLSTPVTIQELVRGQVLALRRQFARPLLILCALELAVFTSHYPASSILLVQSLLLADMLTLMWVSMWLSLSARSLNHVILLAMSLVLILPWTVFAVLMQVLEGFPSARGPEAYQAGLGGLTLAGLAWAAVWLGFRKDRLDQWRWLAGSLALGMSWLIYLLGLTVSLHHQRLASPRRTIPFEPRVLVWFVVGMACNLVILRWARPRLLASFRAAVLRRFERTPDDPSGRKAPRRVAGRGSFSAATLPESST